jgi:hypothetical protein
MDHPNLPLRAFNAGLGGLVMLSQSDFRKSLEL